MLHWIFQKKVELVHLKLFLRNFTTFFIYLKIALIHIDKQCWLKCIVIVHCFVFVLFFMIQLATQRAKYFHLRLSALLFKITAAHLTSNLNLNWHTDCGAANVHFCTKLIVFGWMTNRKLQRRKRNPTLYHIITHRICIKNCYFKRCTLDL